MSSTPVRVAVAVVVAKEVDIFLRVLCDLQWLVDRVEKIVGQVGGQVDELWEAPLDIRNSLSEVLGLGGTSSTAQPRTRERK